MHKVPAPQPHRDLLLTGLSPICAPGTERQGSPQQVPAGSALKIPPGGFPGPPVPSSTDTRPHALQAGLQVAQIPLPRPLYLYTRTTMPTRKTSATRCAPRDQGPCGSREAGLELHRSRHRPEASFPGSCAAASSIKTTFPIKHRSHSFSCVSNVSPS